MIKKVLLLVSMLSLFSCSTYNVNKTKKIDEKKFYSSAGFALIYNENLVKDGVLKKSLDNNKVTVIHSFLKKNTTIKIINPTKSKSVIVKVNKRDDYPKIFNIVITDKVAKILELDFENPYVEVFEIKKNKTFISKKAKTFEEEKNVANTAPVEKIEIDNISSISINDSKPENNKNFFLILSDFYYQESAINLKKELVSKTNLKNLSIKKINSKKYRLYAGPFKNFNSLKSSYISLNKIGFEDLYIIKE